MADKSQAQTKVLDNVGMLLLVTIKVLVIDFEIFNATAATILPPPGIARIKACFATDTPGLMMRTRFRSFTIRYIPSKYSKKTLTKPTPKLAQETLDD